MRSNEFDDLSSGPIHETKSEGSLATWRLEHCRIVIVAVQKESDSGTIVRFGSCGCPDLADVRELLPELAKLWDAVRHDMWAVLLVEPPKRFT